MSWLATGAIVVSAGTAAYGASQQNKAAKKQAGAFKGLPEPPDYNDSFNKGFLQQYKVTPWLAQQEFELRQKYLPAQQKAAAQVELEMMRSEAKLEAERERSSAMLEFEREKAAQQAQLARDKAEFEAQLARDKATSEAELAIMQAASRENVELSRNRPGGDLSE